MVREIVAVLVMVQKVLQVVIEAVVMVKVVMEKIIPISRAFIATSRLVIVRF